MAEPFGWSSYLGISVGLFLFIGGLWVVIGVLTVLLLNRNVGPRYLFVSNSADSAYFGASPERLLSDDQALFKLRTILIRVIAGFLVTAGLLYISIAWFALRQGHLWALLSLVASGMLGTLFWALALSPYIRQGVQLRIRDLPPFIWLPAVLLIPAFVLGWIGLG